MNIDAMIQSLEVNTKATGDLLGAMEECNKTTISIVTSQLQRKCLHYADKWGRSSVILSWYYRGRMRKAKYNLLIFMRQVKQYNSKI